MCVILGVGIAASVAVYVYMQLFRCYDGARRSVGERQLGEADLSDEWKMRAYAHSEVPFCN